MNRLFGFVTALVLAFLGTRTWASEFYQEYRRTQLSRLGQLVPVGNRRPSETGVFLKKMAGILEIRASYVSEVLNSDSKHLADDHFRILADRFGVAVEYLRCEDLFDRFTTVTDLLRATRTDELRIQRYLVDVYIGRDSFRRDFDSPIAESFEIRRKERIRERLAEVLPGGQKSPVDITRLSQIVGVTRSYGSRMINGPMLFKYEYVEPLARQLGVEPGWVLAADMLDDFPTVNHLAAAVADEPRATLELLLDLWHQRYDCRKDFALGRGVP